MDSKQSRNGLGQFTTGLTKNRGTLIDLTANASATLSREPPFG